MATVPPAEISPALEAIAPISTTSPPAEIDPRLLTPPVEFPEKVRSPPAMNAGASTIRVEATNDPPVSTLPPPSTTIPAGLIR